MKLHFFQDENSEESADSIQPESELVPENSQDATQAASVVEENTDDLEDPQPNNTSTDEIDRVESIQTQSLINEKHKFTKPTTPKRKRTRKETDVEDPRIEKAFQFLQQPEDPTMTYVQHLANKLKQFQGRTRVLVEHALNQVIFDAEMGYYNNVPPQFARPYSTYSSHPYHVPVAETVVGPLSSPSSSRSSQHSWSAPSDREDSSPPSRSQREDSTQENDLLSQLQSYIKL